MIHIDVHVRRDLSAGIYMGLKTASLKRRLGA